MMVEHEANASAAAVIANVPYLYRFTDTSGVRLTLFPVNITSNVKYRLLVFVPKTRNLNIVCYYISGIFEAARVGMHIKQQQPRRRQSGKKPRSRLIFSHKLNSN